MRYRRAGWMVFALAGFAIRSVEAQGPPGMAMPPPQVAVAAVAIKTVPVSYE